MAEKEIEILKELIEKLDDRLFDLEAWKNRTGIFLERIFGKDSSKVKLISELRYDYSSWNLRDTAGAGQAKDPVRFKAKGILEAAIEELAVLGLPESTTETARLTELLRDELTGRQIKEIETIIQSDLADKQERIARILESLEKERLATLLARLMLP